MRHRNAFPIVLLYVWGHRHVDTQIHKLVDDVKYWNKTSRAQSALYEYRRAFL